LFVEFRTFVAVAMIYGSGDESIPDEFPVFNKVVCRFATGIKTNSKFTFQKKGL